MILIREPNNADVSFIFDSWLRSYRRAFANVALSCEDYYPAQRAKVEAILQKATVLVAANEHDPDQIFGYIVFKHPNSLHYVFIKHLFRRMGICERLMQAAFSEAITQSRPIYTDHSTYKLPVLKKKFNLVFKETIR